MKSNADFDPYRLANLDISRELHLKLANSFSKEAAPGASDYPNWYGGSFMDDLGKLTVYVTPNFLESRVAFDSVKTEVFDIVESDNVLFMPCEYSFRYLTETVDFLNSIKLNSTEAIADNFNSHGIYDKENRLYVFFDEFTEENIEIFKKTINNSGCIIYAESEGVPIDHVNVDPGDRIQSNTGGGSVAYRARRGGLNGIVTAGHVATTTASGNNWIRYGSASGTIFAETKARQQSGSVDAAWCEITNTSYVPTNNIMGGTLLTSTLNPSVGDVVYKIGYASNLTSGTVTSTNYNATVGGISFTNLSRASYNSLSGDSGGLVCTFNMSTSTGYTVGIHKASTGANDSLYTKASLANSALSMTRY